MALHRKTIGKLFLSDFPLDFINPNDKTFFKRLFKRGKFRRPTFYILFKIHKIPWATRPVVSCCGSLLAALSTWIDVQLQKIRHLIPGYLKDSDALIRILLSLQDLPPHAKIFTCDATAMYTNIDIDHLLWVVDDWLRLHDSKLPPLFPVATILEALKLVMKHNIFHFGDTWWMQKIGTAMGTPCACIIATIYFAHYEKFTLLPKYNSHLQHYFRFIDDGFGIWTPPTDPDSPIDPNSSFSKINDSNNIFEEFKKDLNKFGLLRWTVEELSNEIVYLDLIIKIDKGRFTFKTYQKDLNLYLYIPPHSAHPPGVQKSLVFGCLLKYWKQNSNPDDFVQITKLFFHRLQARGHTAEDLRILFMEAAKKLPPKHSLHIEKTPLPKNNNDDAPIVEDDQLFFKYIYHPKDISRLTIRSIYEKRCETPILVRDGFSDFKITNNVTMKIKKLTIAYRRDENLRDRLIPSRILEAPGKPISEYLLLN